MTQHTPLLSETQTADAMLRARALLVVPGGMWGHLNAARLPDGYPQFFASAEGCRVRDVDGREYIDFMCSWGPIVLGHRHPQVQAAAEVQAAKGDCFNGPGEVMVELAEDLVAMLPHADWAMFQKNGGDATTCCVTIARAGTGRRKVLVARGSYHGALPWCSPSVAGVTAEDRAHLVHFEYNDVQSLRTAVAEAGKDLAAILVTAFRHDMGRDLELPTKEFAVAARAACDAADAALIIDEVRAGLRLDIRGGLGSARRAPGPVCLEQGDRQRLCAGCRHRQRSFSRSRHQDLRHRVVLVRHGSDGGGAGDVADRARD